MKKPSPYLTFAGTIPFIACAIMITLGIDAVIALGTTAKVLSAYGLVIASFMAGAHWGNHLSLADDDSWAARLPIFSNIVALVLWLGFLILSSAGFIWLLIIGFLALLIIDHGLYQANIIDKTYLKIRKYVTLIVVISLVVSALGLQTVIKK